MYVTEQLHHLMVKVIGEAEEREVVHNNRPALNDDDFLEVNAVKPFKHRALPEYSLRVMVTEDKVDMAVQSSRFQTPVPFLNIAEAEISEVIYMVVGLNNRVPVIYKRFVHFLHRTKRSVAIPKDVIMEPVGVAAEVNVFVVFLLYFSYEIILIHCIKLFIVKLKVSWHI
jgi:hypothetical protein